MRASGGDNCGGGMGGIEQESGPPAVEIARALGCAADAMERKTDAEVRRRVMRDGDGGWPFAGVTCVPQQRL